MTGIRKFKTVVTSSLLCWFLVWPNICFPFFLFFFFLTRLRCTWEVRDDFPSANFSNKIVLFRVSLKYNDDDNFIYLFRHFIYCFISIIKITLSPIIPNLSKNQEKIHNEGSTVSCPVNCPDGSGWFAILASGSFNHSFAVFLWIWRWHGWLCKYEVAEIKCVRRGQSDWVPGKLTCYKEMLIDSSSSLFYVSFIFPAFKLG